MMDGYDEKRSHYDDEPPQGSFVRAFDAFRRSSPLPPRYKFEGSELTFMVFSQQQRRNLSI
jgi:hypothetical protein